ncbi:DUF3089 domain-containing protein [Halioglobus sp.]|nr:DUF3089 domain-containing protein [Halioglobus sp.]
MKALKIAGVSVTVIALIAIMLSVSGLGGRLFLLAFTAYNKPSGTFDSAEAVAAPDYSEVENWAALPTTSDYADLVPKGVSAGTQGEFPVDVFFIHPTGFLTSEGWTSPMDVNSGTEENTRLMMANQASAFNGCCNVYAPRYRQANIFAYFGEAEERDRILAFAYQDVKRAFDHFINHYNQNRPFIIASHSQGTHHATRLLKEVIDPSDLHQRMVAAYLIGSTSIPVSPSWFDAMGNIKACSQEDDLHCVIHWDSKPEGATAYERPEPSLCTNPLSWRTDEEMADATLNEGALPRAGKRNDAIGQAPDTPNNQIVTALEQPIPALASAQCKGGTLYVGEPAVSGFETDRLGTYHILEYSLFYMNIHNNAKLRAQSLLTH